MTKAQGIYNTKGTAMEWIDRLIASDSGDQCADGWPFLMTKEGYPRLHVAGLGMRLGSHVVLERSGRPRPDAPNNKALHSCHNQRCLLPAHLRWGSSAENSREMVESGRQSRGTARHSAKLNDELVREIRSSDEPHTVLAEKYGVRPAAIREVRARQTWRHAQ